MTETIIPVTFKAVTYYKQTKYICYDVTKKAPFRRKTFKITICRAFKKNCRTKQKISRAKSKLQVLFKKLFLNSTEAPGCLRVANFSCCFMQAVKENFNHNVYCITAGVTRLLLLPVLNTVYT